MNRLRDRWRTLRWSLTVLALALTLVSCTTAETPAPAPPTSTTAPLVSADAPPEWKPGDSWVYEWTSGDQRGTKDAEVVEVRQMNAAVYYVVRFSDLEHYYTRDLHWAAAVRSSRVEARMLPPQPWFTWPLAVGTRWTHRGTYENTGGRAPHDDRFTVVAAETVEVPAGRFSALRIARETDRYESDEYWYVPQIRWYVRWVGRRGDVRFEERLLTYRPAVRSMPAPAR